MCGRLRLPTDHSETRIELKITRDEYAPPFVRRKKKRGSPETVDEVRYYNVPPSAFISIVTHDNESGRLLKPARWTFVPTWHKGEKDPLYRTINAMVETIAERNTYRDAWKKGRRAICVSAGHYEWRESDGQPFAFGLKNRGPMYLACIWEPPVGPRDYRTFAIITAGATGLLGELHDRAPGLIDHDDVPAWLGEEDISPDDALKLVRQLSPDSVEAWPVSRKVSSVANEGPELAEPVALKVGQRFQART